jgi:outer membrane autotransporter protein
MVPFTFDPLSIGSGNYRFSTSMLQMRRAAASVALAHGSTKNTMYVENYRFDAWFEAQYKIFDDGAAGEGHFGIAYLGADYVINSNLLVGALIQVDDMEDKSASLNTSASGVGWMVGPYMTARLAPNLYFDARIAAGKSTNKVSPFNTYTDTFHTDRWMAMMNLTGEFQRGAWTIRPNASLAYFEETQASYIDSLAVAIPSQTVKLGQLKIGPTFSGKFETLNGGYFEPTISFEGIYNIGETTGVTITNPSSPAVEGWRGRIEAGLAYTTDTGTRIAIGGTYDGLFRDNYETIGLKFDLTIPLKKNKAK